MQRNQYVVAVMVLTSTNGNDDDTKTMYFKVITIRQLNARDLSYLLLGKKTVCIPQLSVVVSH